MGKQIGYAGLEDDKMNNHFKSTLNNYKKTMNSDGKDVADLKHQIKGDAGKNPVGPMKGNLMNFTEILEAMDDVMGSIENATDIGSTDITTTEISEPSIDGDDREKRLLNKLNEIFTPILIMQGFESDTSERIQEAMSVASVLTEKNVIKFDDQTRMAQLIATCATLLQQDKNTKAYQTYMKAAKIRNTMKLQMQKEEYDDAKALAQKYLVMVSTSNNSSIARNAATSLLPETQH